MTYYVVKVAVTAILVVLISEVSKRSSVAGAILASIPLVSVLAMIWLYAETGDVTKVSALATAIFWLVIPSLALFLSLPLLLKHGIDFTASMAISIAVTVACYLGMLAAANHLGIRL